MGKKPPKEPTLAFQAHEKLKELDSLLLFTEIDDNSLKSVNESLDRLIADIKIFQGTVG